ncbi:hypothetical protein [Natronobacterium haloterrestre]|nr:hypothetical protein [Halobiforma haloterrestris]
MNRRTVLRTAGVATMAGLAGCLEGVREHFSVQGVVTLEIVNEADDSYNLRLEAHESETNRQTYDESFTVTPGERAMPQHLERTDQRFRVIKFDGNEQEEIREVSITPETRHVNVYVRDDDLVIDVHRGDDEGNTTVDDGPSEEPTGGESGD